MSDGLICPQCGEPLKPDSTRRLWVCESNTCLEPPDGQGLRAARVAFRLPDVPCEVDPDPGDPFEDLQGGAPKYYAWSGDAEYHDKSPNSPVFDTPAEAIDWVIAEDERRFTPAQQH